MTTVNIIKKPDVFSGKIQMQRKQLYSNVNGNYIYNDSNGRKQVVACYNLFVFYECKKNKVIF